MISKPTMLEGGRRRAAAMDVARRAGVSQVTVSLVLNRVPDIRIPGDARRRVHDAAAVLDYRVPQRGAGAVRVLGFLTDEISSSPFAAIAADAARDAALEHNALLLVAVSHGDPEVEDSVLDLWRRQEVSGVVYARTFTRRVTIPKLLREMPAALLNCYDPDAAMPAVVPAEHRAGRTATRHLLEAGHRRIAIISGERWMEAARDRASGYRLALREAGIAEDPALSRSGDWTPNSAREATLALMRLPEPPTAIFCGSDQMAWGCCNALRELGLSVPRDVSVIGFDNLPTADFIDPPLTTLELPHAAMGQWAVASLFGAESRPAEAASPSPTRIKCALIERGSVAPPRGATRPG